MRRHDEKTAASTPTPARPEPGREAPTPAGAASDTTPGQRIPTLSFSPVSAPSPSLPKGGGALRGIGEKFQANPVSGTASLSVPIFVSPGRQGFQPALSLSYDSGAGNGPFGLGWSLGVPRVQRKTDRGLPTYRDHLDTFVLSDSEDLLPFQVWDSASSAWIEPVLPDATDGSSVWKVQRSGGELHG